MRKQLSRKVRCVLAAILISDVSREGGDLTEGIVGLRNCKMVKVDSVYKTVVTTPLGTLSAKAIVLDSYKSKNNWETVAAMMAETQIDYIGVKGEYATVEEALLGLKDKGLLAWEGDLDDNGVMIYYTEAGLEDLFKEAEDENV